MTQAVDPPLKFNHADFKHSYVKYSCKNFAINQIQLLRDRIRCSSPCLIDCHWIQSETKYKLNQLDCNMKRCIFSGFRFMIFQCIIRLSKKSSIILLRPSSFQGIFFLCQLQPVCLLEILDFPNYIHGKISILKCYNGNWKIWYRIYLRQHVEAL